MMGKWGGGKINTSQVLGGEEKKKFSRRSEEEIICPQKMWLFWQKLKITWFYEEVGG